MRTLTGLWVCASAGAAVYAFLTLPRWLIAKMNRSAAWRLRDRVFDARRVGELPDTPDVERFLTQVEDVIVVLPTITATELWWFRRYHPRFITAPWPEGPKELASFRRELGRVLLRQYWLGSWSGLLIMAPRRLKRLKTVLGPQDSTDAGRASRDSQQDDRDVVAEVEHVVSQRGKRRDNDLIAAAG